MTAGTGRRAQAAGAAELAAVQAALAAEHATVYGYGVVGAYATGPHRAEAERLHAAHRESREELRRRAAELGGTPVAAAAGYALPFAVTDDPSAVALATVLEERLAGAYADLVRATTGGARQAAAGRLRRTALRAARWRGTPDPFPGLAEYADAPPAEPAAPEASDGTDAAGGPDERDG